MKSCEESSVMELAASAGGSAGPSSSYAATLVVNVDSDDDEPADEQATSELTAAMSSVSVPAVPHVGLQASLANLPDKVAAARSRVRVGEKAPRSRKQANPVQRVVVTGGRKSKSAASRGWLVCPPWLALAILPRLSPA